MANIGDTFVDHSQQDRMVLMLAVHRLVLRLLAAMGEAIEQAVQREDANLVEVAVEESDDSIYMQLPTVFQQLLQELVHSLESIDKTSQPRVAEWLVDWLDHRCANAAGGWFLGHSTGNVAAVLAVLATFVGDDTSNDWGRCDDAEAKQALEWAQRLQPHLQLHPGSRQARGLAPARGPVMLFSKPMPDDSDDCAPLQAVHGDLPTSVLDQVISLDDTGVDAVDSGPPATGSQEEEETHYLAGLRTPVDRPTKVRVLMVEVSTGSSDIPRRTLRIPLGTNGTADVRLRLRQEDEDDQDGIATQPVGPCLLGAVGAGAVPQPLGSTATQQDSSDVVLESEDVPMDLVRDLAARPSLSEDDIRGLYGTEILHFVQVQRAMQEGFGGHGREGCLVLPEPGLSSRRSMPDEGAE